MRLLRAALICISAGTLLFFAVFAYWFFRFLAEEERREDVDPPPVAA